MPRIFLYAVPDDLVYFHIYNLFGLYSILIGKDSIVVCVVAILSYTMRFKKNPRFRATFFASLISDPL